MKFLFFAFFSTIGSISAILLSGKFPIQAQVIPDRTLGSESSVVTPNQNIRGIPSDRIDGGAVRGGNLFHSFQEFNVDEGRGVYFSNPDNIINILSRVTGGNISEILGTLGVLGNANLFLINPNGIVFGPNARLDVGGSFFATTADGILFENGFEFAASNPEAPPLLTINMPLGLNIRENPATIQVRGSGHNLSFDEGTGAIIRENRPVGLQVPENQTLALIGGDILLEGGNLTAADGRVELGSVSGSGIITFTSQLNEPLNYNEISTFGRVQLSQAASVEVSGNRGGDINVHAANIELIDGSAMLSGTLGSETGGTLTITASESLELNGTTLDNQFASSLFADIAPDATGQGSNLNITTGSLRVINGAQIAANTVGAGNGGEVNITANDVEVVGTSSDGQFLSSLAASVNSGATGNGGNLTINAQNLRVFDSARITGGTLGEGDGGSLTLNTQNLLLRNRAGIVASTFGAGDGGNLAINTENLSIADGSGIAASTFGAGDGGELTVTATNIELMNVSALSASVEQNATGDGGTLTVNTQRLLIQDRSQILAVVFGNGNGRDLTVNATDIELVGTGSGLFASVNPGAIGEGGDIIVNTQRLTLRDGAQILAATFGNGNGGDLTVNATDIELVGTSANRQFSSSLGTSVQPDAMGKGGNLTINTQRLVIRDGAQISASTFGNGDAGDLTVTATDVDLVGIAVGDRPLASGLAASVNPGASGNAGTLTLNTQRLTIRDGAQISASTAGNGDGGDLTLTANNIEIIGTSVDGEVSSGIVASVNPGATGQGGILIVNTRNLRIQDGAGISVATFASGDGGNLIITATDVELMGTGSGLFTSVEEEATGNGGSLNIDTQRLQVQNGAQVLASTFGDGDVGDLTVTATDVELTGAGSGLFASVETSARANSGTLTIDTQNLRIQDGADVSTSTFGNGNGGDLTVTATDIELKGTGSVLGASVEPGATGNGGTLTVDTRNLRVQDGAQVSAATSGNGDGGDLTIQATNVELIGITHNNDSQFPTGLFTSALSTSTGQGGTLTVNAENLTVRDGASIDVRSEGIERAGDLIVNAPTILLDNEASLNAETTAGQGNIILNTSDLRLRNNSNITTNATGEATGGNIEINTDNLIAIEDSDISANAQAAFGGQVIINANAIFGTQFRTQQSGASDITATSELGPEFSGTVELNTEIDPSSGLIELDANVVDPNALIAQNVCELGKDSQFIATGRGGLPPNPRDLQRVNLSRVGLIETIPNNSTQNSEIDTQEFTISPQQLFENSQTSNNQEPVTSENIIPARGWIRNEKGEVILVSYDPTKTGVRRQPYNFNNCQP